MRIETIRYEFLTELLHDIAPNGLRLGDLKSAMLERVIDEKIEGLGPVAAATARIAIDEFVTNGKVICEVGDGKMHCVLFRGSIWLFDLEKKSVTIVGFEDIREVNGEFVVLNSGQALRFGLPPIHEKIQEQWNTTPTSRKLRMYEFVCSIVKDPGTKVIINSVYDRIAGAVLHPNTRKFLGL